MKRWLPSGSQALVPATDSQGLPGDPTDAGCNDLRSGWAVSSQRLRRERSDGPGYEPLIQGVPGIVLTTAKGAAAAVAVVCLFGLGACSSPGSKKASANTTSITSTAPVTTSTTSTPVSQSPASGPDPTRPAVSGPPGGPVPAKFVAASVSYINDRQGWALGNAPCPTQPCTSMLRTTDGGVSWSGIPAPPAPLMGGVDNPAAIDQLRFVDPLDGFADGEGLWSTHDGGATWQRQTTVAGISGDVVSDVAPTPGGVYALVSGTDPRGGSDSHYRLARSDPRSGVFVVIADFGANTQPGPFASSGRVAYLTVGQSVSGVGGQLVRVDGTSVTKTPLPSPSGDACGPLTASTPTAFLLECGGGVASGAMGSRSLEGSIDSGGTYHRLPDPGQGAGYDDSGIADAGNGYAVIGTSSSNQSALLFTGDGGKTWHESLTLNGGQYGGGFGDLGFEDATHGVVIVDPSAAAGEEPPYPQAAGDGEGTLYRTTDRGATWTRFVF